MTTESSKYNTRTLCDKETEAYTEHWVHDMCPCMAKNLSQAGSIGHQVYHHHDITKLSPISIDSRPFSRPRSITK